jgi:hypothetical protein
MGNSKTGSAKTQSYKSAGRDKNAGRRILEVSCARDYIMSCADSRLEHPMIIEDDESLSEGTAGIPQKKRPASKSGRAEAACQRHLIPVDDLNHVNDQEKEDDVAGGEARTHHDRGCDGETRANSEKVTSKKKLGADHPDTLTIMANLASTYRNQGRWDAAEELEVQVMETSKNKLGADHPATLTSMNNLAFTWKGTGKETEAVRLMEECVQLRKCVLGLNHPDSISSCTALDTWKAEQESTFISGMSEMAQVVDIELVKLTLRTPTADTKITVLKGDDDAWESGKAVFLEKLKENKRDTRANTKILVQPFHKVSRLQDHINMAEEEDIEF